MDDSHNQQPWIFANALDFATAVDDGVDSHFPFDNDPGEDGGVVVFEGLLGGRDF